MSGKSKHWIPFYHYISGYIKIKHTIESCILEKKRTTVRYHFISTRMAVLKDIKVLAGDVENLEPTNIAGGKVKWYSVLDNNLAVI